MMGFDNEINKTKSSKRKRSVLDEVFSGGEEVCETASQSPPQSALIEASYSNIAHSQKDSIKIDPTACLEDDLLTQTRTQLEKKVGSLRISGQYQAHPDEEEIRMVRCGYTKLFGQASSNRNQLVRGDTLKLESMIDEANLLFKHVHTTSDATFDARFVATFSDISAEKTAKMSSGGLGDFSALDFVRLVKSVLSSKHTFLSPETDEPSSSLHDRHRSTNNDRLKFNAQVLDSSYDDQSNLRQSSKSGFLGTDIKATSSFEIKRMWVDKLGPLAMQDWRGVFVAPSMAASIIADPVRIAITPPNRDRRQSSRSTSAFTSSAREDTVRPTIVDKDGNLPTGQGERPKDSTPDLVKAAYDAFLKIGHPIPFYRFIVDPQSFSRTVENLFYVAFLVNDNRIKLTFEPKTNGVGDHLLMHPIVDQIMEDEGPRQKNQAIYRMSMSFWQELIQEYSIDHALF